MVNGDFPRQARSRPPHPLPLLLPVAGVPWSDTDLVLIPVLQIVSKWWLFMHMHVLRGVS